MDETFLDESRTAACLTASTAGRVTAYLRSHDVRTMADDLVKLARRHPSESLLAAGFAGLLVGRMLFDHSKERHENGRVA